jgi:hypothetical protein
LEQVVLPPQAPMVLTLYFQLLPQSAVVLEQELVITILVMVVLAAAVEHNRELEYQEILLVAQELQDKEQTAELVAHLVLAQVVAVNLLQVQMLEQLVQLAQVVMVLHRQYQVHQ